MHFNPRSREGATPDLLQKQRRHPISIHAPAKERLTPSAACCQSPVFQSTLPRRSDCLVWVSTKEQTISIHAPAKERPDIVSPSFVSLYFNPRSREGATVFIYQCSALNNYFNPRSREAAPKNRFPIKKAVEISIHAPAKERQFHQDYNPLL